MAIGIHNGAQTHIQDQAITCVNFKVKNRRNKSVVPLIPLSTTIFSAINY